MPRMNRSSSSPRQTRRSRRVKAANAVNAADVVGAADVVDAAPDTAAAAAASAAADAAEAAAAAAAAAAELIQEEEEQPAAAAAADADDAKQIGKNNRAKIGAAAAAAKTPKASNRTVTNATVTNCSSPDLGMIRPVSFDMTDTADEELVFGMPAPEMTRTFNRILFWLYKNKYNTTKSSTDDVTTLSVASKNLITSGYVGHCKNFLAMVPHEEPEELDEWKAINKKEEHPKDKVDGDIKLAFLEQILVKFAKKVSKAGQEYYPAFAIYLSRGVLSDNLGKDRLALVADYAIKELSNTDLFYEGRRANADLQQMFQANGAPAKSGSYTIAHLKKADKTWLKFAGLLLVFGNVVGQDEIQKWAESVQLLAEDKKMPDRIKELLYPRFKASRSLPSVPARNTNAPSRRHLQGAENRENFGEVVGTIDQQRSALARISLALGSLTNGLLNPEADHTQDIQTCYRVVRDTIATGPATAPTSENGFFFQKDEVVQNPTIRKLKNGTLVASTPPATSGTEPDNASTGEVVAAVISGSGTEEELGSTPATPRTKSDKARTGELWSLDDFVYTNILGSGSFGVALLGHLKEYHDICVVVKLEDHKAESVDSKLVDTLCGHSKVRDVHVAEPFGFFTFPDPKKVNRLWAGIIMEYGGMSLDKQMSTFIILENENKVEKRKKLVKVAVVIGKTLEGLVECHSKQVMHRDIKPHNVLAVIDNDKEDDENGGILSVKICDFGLAKEDIIVAQEEDGHTQEVGTKGYRALEVMKSGVYSYKADVYSTGIMLQVLVSGKFDDNGLAFLENIKDVDEGGNLRRIWEMMVCDDVEKRFTSKEAAAVFPKYAAFLKEQNN